jgi:hypothetical protein
LDSFSSKKSLSSMSLRSKPLTCDPPLEVLRATRSGFRLRALTPAERLKLGAQAGLAAAYISFNHRGDGEHVEMIEKRLTDLSAL